MTRRPRAVIGKLGLDGHDRGAKVIAAALRDAGFEVVYTGLRSTVDAIAAAAVQEGADLVGLSILSGAHLSLAERLFGALRARGGESIPVVLGGVIPTKDRATLERLGVTAIFGQEDALETIIEKCREIASSRVR